MENNLPTILIAGAGGFIGGHLVAHLSKGPNPVRAVDIKPFQEWYQFFDNVENLQLDLRNPDECRLACRELEGGDVFNLAADMGGMGFIETHKADCMISVLINTNLIIAARDTKVGRYFYASSACVYNADKQRNINVTPLKESDAYPAMPEDGYGWEKLFSERMCRHFAEDYGLYTRVARFHNVYGEWSTWTGGREKAPAAICRKVIEAELTGDHRIEIWGDGTQTRSFMWIDDCITGIQKIMNAEILEPINLGSSELISINGLVDMVESFSGIKLERYYDINAPKGVIGRNSDNTLIRQYLNWEPSTPLSEGMRKNYAWIREQMVTK